MRPVTKNTIKMEAVKSMKIIQWLVFITGLILIIVHGFWPNSFAVDGFTVSILFILLIPSIAQYLRRAKIPGAEFEFKDEIRKTEEIVQRSVEQAEKERTKGKRKFLPFETFKLSAAKELLDSDPVLALASLRIEIERKLRSISELLHLQTGKGTSPSKLIQVLKQKKILSSEQIEALQRIISMCNKAIHGSSISIEEAKEIIHLSEKLNKTFNIGYSIDVSPNTDYVKHGLFCEWEHCIEWMPLREEVTAPSCPVFGHNCPGGNLRISS